MAIVLGDILTKLSIKTGAAGNAAAQPNPNLSLGKYISTTQLAVTLHGLFDVISGAENLASVVDYRCIFVHNSHATLTFYGVGVYIVSQVALGASIQIGVDPTAASAIAAATAQAVEIATEIIAPAGVTFSAPIDVATSISLGDIAAGQCRAIWIKRSAANTAAKNADGATLAVFGDTGE